MKKFSERASLVATMRHIKQPTPTSCGQACVAMISGAPVKRVIEALPDVKRGTTCKQLRTIAPSFGVRLLRPVWSFAAASRVISITNDIIYIARIAPPTRKSGHFVVIDWRSSQTPIVHDPLQDQSENYQLYIDDLEKNKWQIVSWMRVYERLGVRT